MKITYIQLQDTLKVMQKQHKLFKGLFFKHSEVPRHKAIALAKKNDNTSISIKTDFMTYSEMECFFRGFLFAKQK